MDIQQVTDIAIEYIKKAGYSFAKVVKVSPDEISGEWRVSIDVGGYATIIKNIVINDRNGRIIRFE